MLLVVYISRHYNVAGYSRCIIALRETGLGWANDDLNLFLTRNVKIAISNLKTDYTYYL